MASRKRQRNVNAISVHFVKQVLLSTTAGEAPAPPPTPAASRRPHHILVWGGGFKAWSPAAVPLQRPGDQEPQPAGSRSPAGPAPEWGQRPHTLGVLGAWAQPPGARAPTRCRPGWKRLPRPGARALVQHFGWGRPRGGGLTQTATPGPPPRWPDKMTQSSPPRLGLPPLEKTGFGSRETSWAL